MGHSAKEAPAGAGAREGGQATPNLPALLTTLPGDHTRAPQTEFNRARQVLFLESLSVTGSVRSAASAAQVSHQTAYRARRGQPGFRIAWDAALLIARQAAADTLASRAIDGVEEKVFYHGEEVATRTRYSDRLLLAHLARLDRLADASVPGRQGDAHIRFAEDFDGSLDRYSRGEEPLPEDARGGGFSSPGPCNTRSMSYTDEDADEGGHGCGDDAQARRAARVSEQEREDGWLAAEILAQEAAMDAERPADAPQLTGIGPDGVDRDPGGEIEYAQAEAYADGVENWWLVVPPVPVPGKRYHFLGETREEYGDGEPLEAEDDEDDYEEEEYEDEEYEDDEDEGVPETGAGEAECGGRADCAAGDTGDTVTMRPFPRLDPLGTR